MQLLADVHARYGGSPELARHLLETNLQEQ